MIRANVGIAEMEIAHDHVIGNGGGDGREDAGDEDPDHQAAADGVREIGLGECIGGHRAENGREEGGADGNDDRVGEGAGDASGLERVDIVIERETSWDDDRRVGSCVGRDLERGRDQPVHRKGDDDHDCDRQQIEQDRTDLLAAMVVGCARGGLHRGDGCRAHSLSNLQIKKSEMMKIAIRKTQDIALACPIWKKRKPVL